MKHISLVFYLLFLFGSLIRAQEATAERVFVHLDKDCYIAGEDVWMKFLVVDNNLLPSTLSSVGYVEISNTEKPYIQTKLALTNGKGATKVQVPPAMPSGIYQLSAYTRYMRNEGEAAFFKRQIAVINMTQQESDKVELVNDTQATTGATTGSQPIKLSTHRKEYGKRSEVLLSLNELPKNLNDLVISVVRNDSVAVVSSQTNWQEQFRPSQTISAYNWTPEYEGHTITGKLNGTKNLDFLESSIAFVGEDIRVMFGSTNTNNQTVSFYTTDVYGKQDVVTSVLYNHKPAKDFRLDIVSPYAASPAETLPPLKVVPENKKLIDRFIGIQLQQTMFTDSPGTQTPLDNLYGFTPVVSYDLDEYTRFPSVEQTIIEFILRAVVRKVDGERRLKVFWEDQKRFNTGNTMVLLDGVPLYDHEHILNYNPFLIKYIHIYDGKYSFGGNFYDCIMSFITYKSNLPSIQLGSESQLFVYDCPELPVTFHPAPRYEDSESRESIRPDFRHTLHWEPFAERMAENAQPISFYTSDLSGEFKVVAEGITADGKVVRGVTFFVVNE